MSHPKVSSSGRTRPRSPDRGAIVILAAGAQLPKSRVATAGGIHIFLHTRSPLRPDRGQALKAAPAPALLPLTGDGNQLERLSVPEQICVVARDVTLPRVPVTHDRVVGRHVEDAADCYHASVRVERN